MAFKTNSLPPAIQAIILNKSTEYPFTGTYNEWDKPGTYLCRQCGLALFRSSAKFHSGCGWPSFDEEILGTVSRELDQDGMRTEILCARCHAHLGHVFHGEQFTKTNIRHCVNSLSLDFVSNLSVLDTEEAIFAAGCFWGVEANFKKLPGVLLTEVGYTGGEFNNPSYRDVCQGDTGHVEAVRVIYDPKQLDYATLVKYFLTIHDPTQQSGQGPDIGSQYLSKIFYYTDEQQKIAENMLTELKIKGIKIATKVLAVKIFWRAEDYHQNYCEKSYD